ncbi:branched-chain amino acid ABC transporter permease [Streptomyces sp. D2-8]|uniref:branched-chain amino acid ABC transporter permease n=1 Tax=Streptomyces sp. D2-8 TaxID=2707767 RepID=UPI0020BF3F1A|nr:branched-chain amino acid ABC transporter permease [Streptomyces sp. D2-8]MCK8437001.1 branched-chain amino acid ABC transporter permease [Streptomyces sp. D2-8]
MDQTIALTLGVLSSAAVLALTAVGLSLSFGLMRIINLAHGEFLTIGAYSSVVSADHGPPWAVGLAAAVAVGLGVGALTELLSVRRLYGSPELSILATFGLSIVVRRLIQLGFGKDYRTVANPLCATKVLGVPFPAYQLLLTGLAVTVVVAVLAVLRFTSLGLRVRAVASDTALSETLGVRSTRVNLVVFAASAGLAATAGALVAPRHQRPARHGPGLRPHRLPRGHRGRTARGTGAHRSAGSGGGAEPDDLLDRPASGPPGSSSPPMWTGSPRRYVGSPPPASAYSSLSSTWTWRWA